MGNIYLMSDIHGHLKLFLAMLEKINFNKNDTLYILGDVIDRGQDSFKIIDYIRECDNIIFLMGNHENMIIQSLLYNNREDEKCWLNNGGMLTNNQFKLFTKEKQSDYLLYLEHLPKYKILEVNDKQYLLCHAGIVPTLDTDIESMVIWQEDNLLWGTEEFLNSDIITPFYIVFGHVPTSRILEYDYGLNEEQYQICEKSKILKWKNKIAIDCGCGFYGGKLGCIRLNDFKEFYVKYK